MSVGRGWEMGIARELMLDFKGFCGGNFGFGWRDVCGFGDGSLGSIRVSLVFIFN